MNSISENTQSWQDVYAGSESKTPWTKNPIPKDIFNKFSKLLAFNAKLLDYGCGDGVHIPFFKEKGMIIVGCDISQNALDIVKAKNPGIEAIQSSDPANLNITNFDCALVWGVMHHIKFDLWDSYLESFSKIIKPGGYMLIAGHSRSDQEFEERGCRTSPTTGEISYAVDPLEELLPHHNFAIVESGYFPFVEAYTGSPRAFKYFLTKRLCRHR